MDERPESESTTPRRLDPARQLVNAAIQADLATIERVVAEHPAAADKARRDVPNLIASLAAHRRTDAIARLVEIGFDVNAQLEATISAMPTLGTALHYAAQHGDVHLVRLLLSLGADPDRHAVLGEGTPLQWARVADQPAVIELLDPITADVHTD
jgi:ankyrin repeat protein